MRPRQLMSAVALTVLGACATLPPVRAARAAPSLLTAARLQTTSIPAAANAAAAPTPLNLAQVNSSATAEARSPTVRVEAANTAARVQPSRDGYLNAVQVYPYEEGALFQVYTAPGQITDIGLQPGETLSGTGPVAAGDTVRWVIGDTESGSGAAARVHILVKPTRAGLQTNLVVNTDRRTYHIELRATASTYMASVSWRYPQDELVALKAKAVAAAVVATTPTVDLANLRFNYRIDGDTPAWRPVRAFDDGRQVFIDFPSGIAEGEMPPLFVRAADGKTSDLVNYRVIGTRMVVDRLFDVAELKLGGIGGRAQSVRILHVQGR